ncbi:hypothetical protein [Aquabacterium sp.]|uniref:hypothetical protein n=1 Tax=Aquabacterium sp. TaxID=1872578 RepID=UPI002C28A67B|nr:hypothetical protein [Aquabacterium sp.]HSW03705.1 hypothetical protein [Aquabacterium sp.]
MRCPAGLARLSSVVCSLAMIAGCATHSADTQPRPTDPAAYAGWACARLFDEIDSVQQRAADVAYAVDTRVGNNMIALGIGITVFWPALMAMRPTGIDATELADLRGRFEAMQHSANARGCGPAPTPQMAASHAAMLPVAPGDRLVYEDRVGNNGSLHELGMRVAALRRDQIEFRLDLDGQPLSQLWRQDLAGNPVLETRQALIGWQHLLQRDLSLGQVLSGELSAAGEARASARVRGQVVAIGPQLMAGRSFDVAVIELFGDAPANDASNGPETSTSTRLDGVMAVDRRSGVLMRLELRCANSRFALRRRLLRVETDVH